MSDGAWKSLLLVLCALAFVAVATTGFDQFGLGGRPWYGFFDANNGTTNQPYTFVIGAPNEGGASATAGVRDGDTVNLRDLPLDTRVRELFQPMATQPLTRILHRGTRTVTTRFVGSTVYEGSAQWKLSTLLPELIANIWFFLCALLIAVRRAESRDGRVLALVLLCFVAWDLVGPANLAIPSATWSLVLYVFAMGCSTVASILLVYLSSKFGIRTMWRRALEWFAYATNIFTWIGAVAGAIGVWMLWIDPLPYLLGQFWHFEGDVAAVAVAAVAIVAVLATPKAERPRTAWLLLPLTVANAASVIFGSVNGLITDWYVFVATQAMANFILALGAAAVTYALLKRRVLDVGFVLNRTIVVGAFLVIVVGAFVSAEWTLSAIFSSSNRNAGLYIGAAVTLTLGLVMPWLYNWINAVVERHLFVRAYKARMRVTRLASGLPYAESFGAIGVTLTKAVCGAFDLPSGAVFRRTSNGKYLRDAAFGWTDDEVLDAVDAERLAMDLQATRAMLHFDNDYLGIANLPSGEREPAIALGLIARQSLVGYVLYSGRSQGVGLNPIELRLLSDVAREASRGYDAVELATRVEHAYAERIEAENQARETLRRSNAELERINEAQARFMPHEFLQILGKERITDVGLGDSVQRTMSVLFSDIRSFTTLSEGMSPAQIFTFLNRYLQRAEPIISENGGFIDKYIGDAVMGLFPKNADDALKAGVELQRDVRVLNRRLKDESLPPLAIGVGVHTGELILGTIGGRNRMETTVIADAVNAASRLEGATKTFGCAVVFSQATKDALLEPERFLVRDLGMLSVKGKHEQLRVYEAFDSDPAEIIVHKQQSASQFSEALVAFGAGDHVTARRLFGEIASANPADGPAHYYAGLADEAR